MPVVVFVLGMGRSGSSAFARLLSACGGTLPKQLFPPHTSNPAGHWEPAAAVRINQTFLLAHRSSWFDPSLRLQADGSIDAVAASRLVTAAARFLEEERVPDDACFILKEPRVTALLPFWLQAAERAGFQSKAVLLYRHPEEVTRSLSERDRLDRLHGYLLWLKYNLLGEAGSRHLPRATVNFHSLLKAPRESLAASFAQAELPLGVPATHMIDSLLDLRLRHHWVDPDRIDDPTPLDLASRLWKLLIAFSEEGPARAQWDWLLADFQSCQGGPAAPKGRSSFTQGLRLQLAQLLSREFPRGWVPSPFEHPTGRGRT
jgi:hypothetical protein